MLLHPPISCSPRSLRGAGGLSALVSQANAPSSQTQQPTPPGNPNHRPLIQGASGIQSVPSGRPVTVVGTPLPNAKATSGASAPIANPRVVTTFQVCRPQNFDNCLGWLETPWIHVDSGGDQLQRRSNRIECRQIVWTGSLCSSCVCDVLQNDCCTFKVHPQYAFDRQRATLPPTKNSL
jgi:hypothetical protein